MECLFAMNRRFFQLGIYVLCVLLVLLVRLNQSYEQEEICSDIDIRKTFANLYQLEHCTAIEGFLRIVLIDEAEAEILETFSFPRLVEITGYFLLYRVASLRSLSNLFPNLAVIRGTKLFNNHSFVIHEMLALEEVALPKLTNILRGSVQINKNPRLCFVDTVDWDLIANNGVGENDIKDNMDSNECPAVRCPAQLNCRTPVGRARSVCWNQKECQKVCNPKCGNKSCNSAGDCCSKECLGGCTDSSSSSCLVCSGLRYQEKCSKTCPPSTFKYADRRCLTDWECLSLPREVWDGHSLLDVRWKPFDRECRPDCPTGYTEDETDPHNCKICVGPCPKVCNGTTVDSVARAQQLSGCTRISGSLEIKISAGENIGRALELNLNLIEEVDGYLKIVRSRPLISLHFFKSLKKINGNTNRNRKNNSDYSLLVYDNINLQELFDETTTNRLEIASDKFFFHLNPKLCLRKIKQLGKNLGLSDFDEHDVSSRTNGDRISCNVRKMLAKIINFTSKSALIYWENLQGMFTDYRFLLGYVVSYKEALHQNVSVFDGRDACSIDTWNEDDVRASDDDNVTIVGHVISNLIPFTQYVVYIRTYTTIKADDLGAQSELLYFTTSPAKPSSPLDLKAVSDNPSEMTLSWLPPTKHNGNVTHYDIEGSLEKEQAPSIDYCKQHLVVTPQLEHSHPVAMNDDDDDDDDDAGQCKNTKENEKEKIDVEKVIKEAEMDIQFEDLLQNYVYMKSNDDSEEEARKKRSVGVGEAFLNVSNGSTFHVLSNVTRKTIKSLKHFAKYTVKVSACHNAQSPNEKLCSSVTVITVRTAPMQDADTIDQKSIGVNVENETRGQVRVTWDEPNDPNGAIVTFELEYKRTNMDEEKSVLECITHRRYRDRDRDRDRDERGYNLTSLSPGNYSLRLRATSLAGYGNWTLPVYFVVPDADDTWSGAALAGIATSAVVVSILLVAGSLWILFKRKYAQQDRNNSNFHASVNPEYMCMEDVYVPDEWEVPREKITILDELGQGLFGTVYSGLANDIVKGHKGRVKCAIKTVNENASVRERIEFLNEASVMKAFSSYHVLRLMGVVSKDQPTLVVMELMAKGDLKAYLLSMRPDTGDSQSNSVLAPSLTNVLRMASEIADGMAYLAAKKFVHRDLAARNCMLAEDLTVKIGDFGMTRDVYETDYYRKGGKGLLPVRWMAPESLKDGVFTSRSDAWSFGIVLWEMATLASQPYQGLSNEQVLSYVIDGGVMERPEACPHKLYDLMRRCWNQRPKLRPVFLDLVMQLLPHTRPNFVTESFYFSDEAERRHRHRHRHRQGRLREKAANMAN